MNYIVALSFFTAEGRLFRTDYSEPKSWEDASEAQDILDALPESAAQVVAQDSRAAYLKTAILA